ncbi:MAG: hypothetical protein ABL921_33815, partial [Pirellula sp.]
MPADWNGLPGPTWQNVTPQAASLSITDLEFDPSLNGQNVVAGVGTTSSFLSEGGPLIGLLFSTDGGTTWNPENADGALIGRGIRSVAHLGNEVIVGSDDDISTFENGLFRVSLTGSDPNPLILPSQFSIGVGQTLVSTGRAMDLVRDIQNPQTLYVALPDASRVPANAAPNAGGIYRSIDSGQSWQRVSTSILHDKLGGMSPEGITNRTLTNRVILSQHNSTTGAGNQNILYVGLVNANVIDRVFRWDINLDSWSEVLVPGMTEGKSGELHFSLVAHPTDPNVLYVGGDINKSTSVANTTRITLPIGLIGPPRLDFLTSATNAPHPDSRGLVFDAFGQLIEVDDGGIYRFDKPTGTDVVNGKWLSLNRNISNFEVTSVAFDPIKLGFVIGTQDNGTAFASSANTYTQIFGGDGVSVKVDQNSSSVSQVYHSAPNLDPLIRRTEVKLPTGALETSVVTAQKRILGDNQAIAGQTRLTQQNIDTKLGFDPTLNFTPTIAINAVRPLSILIGSNFLYESVNGGDTFRVHGGIEPANADSIDNDSDGIIDNEFQPKTPLLAAGASNRIRAIAAGGFVDGLANPNLLYVGFESGEVFVRKGSETIIGRPGASLPSLSGNDPVVDIKIDPRNGHTVYVATKNRIFRSDNDGVAWIDITGSLFTASLTISSLAMVKLPFTTNSLPVQNSDRLFIGTSGGVFSTEVADV